jgi:outer membrane protein assembly factor BamB
VPPGEVALPSGLALVGGVLFVADRGSGVISAYDVEANRKIRSLDTGLGAGALTALSYGPDGKLYFSDIAGGRVLRIEPD